MANIDHFNWTCMCNVRQKYGLSVWIMNELWSWFTSLVNVCRFPEMCYIEITITKIQNDYRCIILQILPISNFSSAQRYFTIPPLYLQMPEKPHVFIEVYILILIYGNVIKYVRTVITCNCWLYALARLQSWQCKCRGIIQSTAPKALSQVRL